MSDSIELLWFSELMDRYQSLIKSASETIWSLFSLSKIPFEVVNLMQTSSLNSIRLLWWDRLVANVFKQDIDQIKQLKELPFLILFSAIWLFSEPLPQYSNVFMFEWVLYRLKYENWYNSDTKMHIWTITLFEVSNEVNEEEIWQYEEWSGEAMKKMLDKQEVSKIKVLIWLDGFVDMSIYCRKKRRKKSINKALITMYEKLIERLYKQNKDTLPEELKAEILDTSNWWWTWKQLTTLHWYKRNPDQRELLTKSYRLN